MSETGVASALGSVSGYVVEMVRSQVQEYGLVVWFDPEGQYESLLPHLAPTLDVARYAGSFFELRRRIDPYLRGDHRPNLLVYVPLAQAATGHALAEIVAAGVVLQPGQQPWQRNTRLDVVARAALRPVLGEEGARRAASQVEAGHLSLTDLDHLGTSLAVPEVLRVTYRADTPSDIALSFLSGSERDEALLQRQGLADLHALLARHLGLGMPDPQGPRPLRDAVARHVLLADLAAGIPEALCPVELVSALPAEQSQRAACVQLARAWRLRQDLQEGYVAAAHEVETRLPVRLDALPVAALASVDTFEGADVHLRGAVLRMLDQEEGPENASALAERRLHGFWAQASPECAAGWQTLLSASRVLRLAHEVQAQVPGRDLHGLVAGYTEGPTPWCDADAEYRRFLDLAAVVGSASPMAEEDLDRLVRRVEHAYRDAVAGLATAFGEALAERRFQIDGVLSQREVFARVVAPALRQARTAYLLVDGLRLELGRHLTARLARRYQVQLRPAVAALPTVTEVGMAALGPLPASAVALVPGLPGKVALRVGDTVLRTREERLEFLRAHAIIGPGGASARIECFHLAELTEKRSAKRRKAAAEADLLVLTYGAIDESGERQDAATARLLMREAADRLAQAVQFVGGLGFERVVISGDHGFLFLGEEIGADCLIDPPGGDTIDLHRRAWVGRGGARAASFIRLGASALGWEGDLEVASPLGLTAFKASGQSLTYLHGGLSPQEVLVPVIEVEVPRATPPLHQGRWHLRLRTPRITTRFLSVEVVGEAQGLFPLAASGVRVEVRDGKRVLSTPVSATYGLDEATGVLRLHVLENGRGTEPDTVALHIHTEPTAPTVSIHLLDADSGQELGRLDDIPVAIAL